MYNPKPIVTSTIRPYRPNSISGYKGPLTVNVPNLLPTTAPKSRVKAFIDSINWNGVSQKAQTIGKELVPYASNILNSMRKVPQPQSPELTAPATTYNRINLSNARNAAQMQVRGANQAAAVSLDPQAAAAVRAANLGEGIKAVAQIDETEANANAQIGNRATDANNWINMHNTQLINAYKQQQTEAQIAKQRESSQNIANAADKFIAAGNTQKQYDLDLQKFDVMSKLYTNGVSDRLMNRVLGKDQNSLLTEENKAKALGLSRQLGGPLLTLNRMKGKIKKVY